jgi:hypothetical protein
MICDYLRYDCGRQQQHSRHAVISYGTSPVPATDFAGSYTATILLDIVLHLLHIFHCLIIFRFTAAACGIPRARKPAGGRIAGVF